MATQTTINKQALERYKQRLSLIRDGATANPFETKKQQKERIELLRKDWKAMVEYYFPHYATSECAAFHLEFAKMVEKNPTFKGFAEWGRGLAKSVWVNVIIPFGLWLRNEKIYLVIVGNNYDKAQQLLADIQAEFEANPRIIHDFGEQQQLGSWEDGFFITQNGFIGQALGMGQSVRGLRVKSQRPTLCVCDDIETKDLVKNPRRQNETVQWIERDLIPTMDGKVRRFIQANNRYAPRMIQIELQTKHPKWKVHHVKAYNPVTYEPTWKAKYDTNYYRELEEEIGSLAALSEYNNEPHLEGLIFTDEMIQFAKAPAINHFQHIVGHWDIAYAGTDTADYNAVKVWGVKDKDFWMIDCFVKRSKMREALLFMCDYQKRLPESAIIHWRFESQFWNDEVERTIREVENEVKIKLNLVKVPTPKGRKYDRILTLHPYYQNGRIYYSEKLKGHNDTLVGLAQLKGIEPNYKVNDDSPDADQQAIEYLSSFVRISGYNAPIFGKRTHSTKSF